MTIRRRLTQVSFIFMALSTSAAIASQNWKTTIVNHTNTQVIMTEAGYSWWYPDDLAGTHYLNPNSLTVFNHRSKSGALWDDVVMGINLSIPNMSVQWHIEQAISEGDLGNSDYFFMSGWGIGGAQVAIYNQAGYVITGDPTIAYWGPTAQGRYCIRTSFTDYNETRIDIFDGLGTNNVMTTGMVLYSENRNFHLRYQEDGNLVLYNQYNQARWATGTTTSYGHVRMQDDGNLVIYTSTNQPIWASNTSGFGNGMLVVTDEGKIKLFNQDGTYYEIQQW